MQLNSLKPAKGEKHSPKRVGRGIGCGFGKTCGRGHKGIKSRSGGGVKPGFEGGQQPLQRRLPKFGFNSRIGNYREELRLSEVESLGAELIDLPTLKAANLIGARAKSVKLILSGKLTRAVTIKGLRVTKGARDAVLAAGGRVEG